MVRKSYVLKNSFDVSKAVATEHALTLSVVKVVHQVRKQLPPTFFIRASRCLDGRQLIVRRLAHHIVIIG